MGPNSTKKQRLDDKSVTSPAPASSQRALFAIDLGVARAFLLRFFLLLALLLAPWPAVDGVFTGAFSNVAALVTPDTLSDHVELAWQRSPSGWQSVLLARDSASNARIQVPVDCRALAYVPLSVFLALALATPI